MKRLTKPISTFLIISLFFFGCTKNDIEDFESIEYENLKGTWVNKESFALQFLDFYSESQARFGLYSKNFESYDSLNYRLLNSNKIAINFIGDNDKNETFHDLIKINDETIAISNLTDISENPNIIYLKREIITENINDTIIIGNNQIYFDFEDNIRLQLDSVKSDSRCKIGAECKWEGNAETQLNLIIGGNFQHHFVLNANNDFRTDTLIDNITYKLIDVLPYPEINKEIDFKDYKAKILIKKQ